MVDQCVRSIPTGKNIHSKISLETYKKVCGPLDLRTLSHRDMNRVVMKMFPSFISTNIVDFSYMFEKYTVIGITEGDANGTKVYLRKSTSNEEVIIHGDYINNWIDFGNTPIIAFESVFATLTEFYKIENQLM